MIPRSIQKLLDQRHCYKIALSTPEGERVCEDLIKRFILADPIKSNADVTLINLGKQRMAIEILRKVYTNERDFRMALEKSFAAEAEPQEL
jgi:hypothetical protein